MIHYNISNKQKDKIQYLIKKQLLRKKQVKKMSFFLRINAIYKH